MRTIFTSKFIKTLQTFKEAELKSFETWLRSPWCNTNKNLIRLFEKLRKYHPTFDDRKLTKEKLFKQVLPKGKFSDRRMNNLFSEGYLAAERFLIFQKLTQKDSLQKELLVEAWQDHDLEDRFLKESDKEIKKVDQKAIKEWEDHFDLYRYHRQLYHHPNQSRRIRYGNAILQRMDKELDLLYLLEKATIINEKLFRNRILQNENHETEHDLQLWLKATEHLQHPAIEFYKMRFAYTEKNRLEHYWKLREAFMERYGELGELQQKIHLTGLLNDTVLLIKLRLIDSTENLPLYKIGLKTRVIFHENKLTYTTYATIVGASNAKKNFNFTHKFIEEYTQSLDEQFQKDCEIWARAHTAYNEKYLEKSLDLLFQHDFTIPYFKMLTRVLNAQVYFDLCLINDSYQDYLFNYLASFEKWIIREKIWSEKVKKSVLGFIQICRTLIKYFSNPNYQEGKINRLFENKNHVQAFNWLIEKREEVVKLKNKGRPTLN